MNRRDFLRSAGVGPATLAFPKTEGLFALGETPGGWRTFEVTTSVQVLKPSGPTLIWVAAALIRETPFQRTLANQFTAEGGAAEMIENKTDAVGIIAAKYPAGVTPVLRLTSRAATKNYSVDFSAPGKAPQPDRAELEHFLQPTKVIPTDGPVKATATEATSGTKTDFEKARAIYPWIVDKTYRNPKTQGCRVGDIR